jgi:ATP-dependent Clp protease ATP-binding subunit ClpC
MAALADADSAAARTLIGLGIDLDHARAALRDADVEGSSDELPEEAGRRQMLITVTGNRLALETSDPVIVNLAQAALDALAKGAAAAEVSGAAVIRGDHPASASLGVLWQSLHDSLEDIRRRATAGAAEPEPGRSAPGGEAATSDG